jgi:hypothetical protein
MAMTKFDALLETLSACSEARTWAKGKDFADVWNSCERGDWLLWLSGRMSGKKGWPTGQQVVLAACDCAETALKYVKAGEDRPRIAIETARKWARGEATLDKVRTCAAAADAAAAAYGADAYGADAAAAAAYGAANAAAADAAAADAGAAAAAAYAGAADAGAADARSKTLQTCADLVRKAILMPKFED